MWRGQSLLSLIEGFLEAGFVFTFPLALCVALHCIRKPRIWSISPSAAFVIIHSCTRWMQILIELFNGHMTNVAQQSSHTSCCLMIRFVVWQLSKGSSPNSNECCWSAIIPRQLSSDAGRHLMSPNPRALWYSLFDRCHPMTGVIQWLTSNVCAIVQPARNRRNVFKTFRREPGEYWSRGVEPQDLDMNEDDMDGNEEYQCYKSLDSDNDGRPRRKWQRQKWITLAVVVVALFCGKYDVLKAWCPQSKQTILLSLSVLVLDSLLVFWFVYCSVCMCIRQCLCVRVYFVSVFG